MTDTIAPIEAMPSGQRLSEWIEAAPIGKTASYELLKALRITPAKTRFPGSAAAVSMLTAEQVAVMDRAAMQVAAGQSIADLTAIITRPRTAVNATDEAQGGKVTAKDRADLMARMDLAERAMASGFPLTTVEVTWILGGPPGAKVGATVSHGRIAVTHHGTSEWSLARIEA
jgi:hypothetical protein